LVRWSDGLHIAVARERKDASPWQGEAGAQRRVRVDPERYRRTIFRGTAAGRVWGRAIGAGETPALPAYFTWVPPQHRGAL
jgi:hypothetical protein